MGTRTEHAPGTFSWVDLSTTDPGAAKSFYAGIFGWAYEDMPVEGGGTYTFCRLGEHAACALSGQMEQEAEMGVPPHWNNYVTVSSVDETVAKAKELGGNPLMDAFDIPAGDGSTAGRMCVLFDPGNAAICVWEPGSHIGAQIVNAHGALTWNELHTGDIGASEAFYGGLFGWTFSAMPTGEGGPEYHIISNGERTNGGIMEAHAGMPPNWLPYFATDSLDAAIESLTGGGGATLNDPVAMPQGRIVAARDPQGAAFALWEGELQD